MVVAKNYPALKNPEFWFFMSMRFFLTVATQMQAVITGWFVFSITHDPLSLGLIGLAEAIPAIGIALYAGHIADIKSKRMILVRSIAMMCFSSSGLACVTSDLFVLGVSPGTSVQLVYFFIFLSGFARGFMGPTGFSFLSQLVPKEQLTFTSTWNSSVWQIGAIAGPAIGGLLYAFAGVSITFMIIISLSLISLLSVFLIQPKAVIPQQDGESILLRLSEGVRFVFNNKVILGAISLDLFAVLFGGAVALLPIFAGEILHTGPEGLGMLRAAPSAGASLTMLLLSFRKPFRTPGNTLIWCVAGFGICMIGFGLSTSFLLSLVLLFVSGIFDSVSVVIRGTILQLQTPDHIRGRVAAVNTMFIGSSNEIGAFESGVAARLIGTIPSVVFGGCMTLLITAFTSVKAKELRKYVYP